MTFVTEISYIFVRYSLTSVFVMLGGICSSAWGGDLLGLKETSLMNMEGNQTRTILERKQVELDGSTDF